MRDPFDIDKQHRDRISEEVCAVRLALWEAREARDGDAALAAIDRMYALVQRYDAKVLQLGEDGADASSVVLPATCKQMTARHFGRCSECESLIRRGDVIYWDPDSRATYCIECFGIPGMSREYGT